MGTGAITTYVDVAQLVLYAFWIAFAAIIFYLVRENRREGYPLVTERPGVTVDGWVGIPPPKTYRLADGTTRQAPHFRVAPLPATAQPVHRSPGGPIEPLGNPLTAGVGPGSWTERADEPALDGDGQPMIRPLSALPGHGVDRRDPDPRGMTLVDAHDRPVGTVEDLWLDVSEAMFRYLQVRLAGDGGRAVLVPMTFARVGRDRVKVHALLAGQYGDAPVPRAGDRITLREEERICAFFGAGLLYAEPSRAEPLL